MDSRDQPFSSDPCRRRWGHGFSSTRSGDGAVGSAVAALFHLDAEGRACGGYEAACQTNQGSAYLRSEGSFSSQITEGRKLRDAGVLTGKQPGERVPSAEKAESARLGRELDRAERRLATTETALAIMGQAHAPLEQIFESGGWTDDARTSRDSSS